MKNPWVIFYANNTQNVQCTIKYKFISKVQVKKMFELIRLHHEQNFAGKLSWILQRAPICPCEHIYKISSYFQFQNLPELFRFVPFLFDRLKVRDDENEALGILYNIFSTPYKILTLYEALLLINLYINFFHEKLLSIPKEGIYVEETWNFSFSFSFFRANLNKNELQTFHSFFRN
jgi:hypothetical protein